jgi:hypothetical protein
MDLTWRELAAYARGVRQRQEQDGVLALWLAWHAAAFSRAKRIPAWERILKRITQHRPKRRKTPQQLLAMAEALNIALGGEDRRKRPPKWLQ